MCSPGCEEYRNENVMETFELQVNSRNLAYMEDMKSKYEIVDVDKVFRIIVQFAMQPDEEMKFVAEGRFFDDEYVQPWKTKLYATQHTFLQRISETLRHPSINVTVQRLIDFVAAKCDADVVFQQVRCKSGGICNSAGGSE